MFDTYARSLLIDVPELEGLTGDAAARALSRAYLALLQLRTSNQQSSDDLPEILSYLRRLANSMIFQVVFDQSRETQPRQAAAFVAAESIALQADFISATTAILQNKTFVFLAERFARVESSLLYLFAEYDACAAGVLTLPIPVSAAQDRVDQRAATWCFAELESLCRLRLARAEVDDSHLGFQSADRLGPQALEQDTIGRLYADLGMAAVEFSSWLSGGHTGLDSSIARLDALLAALDPGTRDEGASRVGHDYSRVFHLATLLRLCLPAMGQRSLCHVVPPPPGSDVETYSGYLMRRATGTKKMPGRPLLWPSAAKFVHEYLLGDVLHGVVSMPTGSGKSFVAELAISQAIYSGWVLYLAPTNALAEQIRGDIRIGLKSLNTEVFAFVGDQEYSTFTTESVAQMQANSVAVMTPEKCALALRISPDAFHNCSLVVFDECHLLGDAGSTRGPTAELVLSQLMLRAPTCRFLLMSAIIQNPQDLAGWLKSATGGNARPVSLRWRPTRTLRAVLGVEDASFQQNSKDARTELQAMRESRKNNAFTARCALAACLQGAWQSEDEPDYGIVSIDCETQLSVSRAKRHGQWKYTCDTDSWVNSTAINLATVLVDKGIQTLVFTPANRHYPFSNGVKVSLAPATLAALSAPPDLIGFLRTLAEYELGVDSLVFVLLNRGIAVHTSLMLEVEKIASEMSFRHRCAPIMFATGTMAQGLNLPAIAVVIAGTRIGDPRGEDANIVKQRKYSQLLNAAGRAGRAGFANQGVVITIPDTAVSLSTFNDVLTLRNQADFLQQADDAVSVKSGLDEFLDKVCKDVIRSDQATDLELQVTALLAGGDEKQLAPEPILRRTYAAYLRKQLRLPDVTASNVQRLAQEREKFVAESGAPTWLTIAAQRAGLDFFLTLEIYSAWGQFRHEWPSDFRQWGVMQWLEELLTLAPFIRPRLLVRHLSTERLSRISHEFKQIAKKRPELFFSELDKWIPLPEWQHAWSTVRPPLESWMQGETIASVAAVLTKKSLDQISHDRVAGKPIPTALSVTGESWASLSLIAGGFLAVAEQHFGGTVPLPLACLPMCIKYGCDSPGSLAWFRFGVRLRRASRMLAGLFPPPPEVQTDEHLRQWVRNQRREWLKSDDDSLSAPFPDLLPVLGAVRAFIKS